MEVRERSAIGPHIRSPSTDGDTRCPPLPLVMPPYCEVAPLIAQPSCKHCEPQIGLLSLRPQQEWHLARSNVTRVIPRCTIFISKVCVSDAVCQSYCFQMSVRTTTFCNDHHSCQNRDNLNCFLCYEERKHSFKFNAMAQRA